MFSGILNRQFIKKTLRPDENADPGEALFVTPYIERGDIETGRQFITVEYHFTLTCFHLINHTNSLSQEFVFGSVGGDINEDLFRIFYSQQSS